MPDVRNREDITEKRQRRNIERAVGSISLKLLMETFLARTAFEMHNPSRVKRASCDI